MKLNGHEYSTEEIFYALRAKGYLIVEFTYMAEDESFPNGTETFKYDTHCAVKDGEAPSEKNLWQNVAIKEFQKHFTKPNLV